MRQTDRQIDRERRDRIISLQSETVGEELKEKV